MSFCPELLPDFQVHFSKLQHRAERRSYPGATERPRRGSDFPADAHGRARAAQTQR